MSETTQMQPITVTLTAEQWNVVGAGLMKLPGEVMFTVYGLIAQQVQAGAHPAVAEPDAPATKKK